LSIYSSSKFGANHPAVLGRNLLIVTARVVANGILITDFVVTANLIFDYVVFPMTTF